MLEPSAQRWPQESAVAICHQGEARGDPRDPLSVRQWLGLRHESQRLFANAAADAPGADEDRIMIMRDLVEKHGRY